MLLLALLIASTAFGADPAPKKSPKPPIPPAYRLTIQRPKAQGKTIPKLELILPVELAVGLDADQNARWEGRVKMRYREPYSNLVALQKGYDIQPSKSVPGEYTLLVPLVGVSTPFTVTAILPTGKIQGQEQFILNCSEWARARQYLFSRYPRKPPSNWVISASLGPTSLRYQERQVTDFSELALTAKLGINYLFRPSNWDLGASGYYTVLPLSSSISEVAARFLGLNVRLGYRFVFSNRWQAGIYGGTYYASMIEAQGSFGFKNLMGPQLYPSLRYSFGKEAFMGYFKLSPIGSGFAVNSPSTNREIAYGIGWSHRLSSSRQWGIQVDFSDLQVDVNDFAFQLKTSSLSLSMSF